MKDIDAISHLAAIRFGWEESRRTRAASDYLAFLTSASASPQARPTKDADELWHLHILNTEAYHRFCNEQFGGYVHHRPMIDGETMRQLAGRVGEDLELFPLPDSFPTAQGDLADCGPGNKSPARRERRPMPSRLANCSSPAK